MPSLSHCFRQISVIRTDSRIILFLGGKGAGCLMTAIVGIRCKDGVVIGADSSATFGDGQFLRTIEQPTRHKLEIIGDRIIVAGTGYVGHGQRFCNVLQQLWDAKKFGAQSGLDTAKMIASTAVNDFAQTIPAAHMKSIDYTALVAYPAAEQAWLCELPGRLGFQPEIKMPDDLWFASGGSGQPLTDPFLALLRQVFWHDGPPNVQGGIFTAYWALKHACDLNPGGIKEPIDIAVLTREKGKLLARKLDKDELAEHANVVGDAAKHMGKFRDVLEGKANGGDAPPEPPKPG
jgi:hypothetical protein